MRYPITLAAGEERTLTEYGNVFYLETADGTVEITADGREPIERAMGQGARKRDGFFEMLRVRNTSGAENNIVLEVYAESLWELNDERTTINGTVDAKQSGTWDIESASMEALLDSVNASIGVANARLGVLLAQTDVPDTGVNGSVNVTGSTVVIAANANNRTVILQPIGGDIHVALAAAATTSHPIVKDGATYVLENYAGEVRCIAASGTVPVKYTVSRVS